MLAQGDTEAGVEHLSRAVAVCGQPQQLLMVLQQTLPTHVFQLLIQKLPSAGEVILIFFIGKGDLGIYNKINKAIGNNYIDRH